MCFEMIVILCECEIPHYVPCTKGHLNVFTLLCNDEVTENTHVIHQEISTEN